RIGNQALIIHQPDDPPFSRFAARAPRFAAYPRFQNLVEALPCDSDAEAAASHEHPCRAGFNPPHLSKRTAQTSKTPPPPSNSRRTLDPSIFSNHFLRTLVLPTR